MGFVKFYEVPGVKANMGGDADNRRKTCASAKVAAHLTHIRLREFYSGGLWIPFTGHEVLNMIESGEQYTHALAGGNKKRALAKGTISHLFSVRYDGGELVAFLAARKGKFILPRSTSVFQRMAAKSAAISPPR